MVPLSDELVLVIVVAAVLLGIYLLRHIIAFALKLIVFAGLVLAGVWVWQHRAEIADAAEPWLGPVGDRLAALDLSDIRHLLAGLLTDDEPSAAETTGVTVADAAEEPGEPTFAGESERSAEVDGGSGSDYIDDPDNQGDPD